MVRMRSPVQIRSAAPKTAPVFTGAVFLFVQREGSNGGRKGIEIKTLEKSQKTVDNAGEEEYTK